MGKLFRCIGFLAVAFLANLGIVNAWPQYGTCYTYCGEQVYMANSTYYDCCFTPRSWAEGCYIVGTYWTPDGEGWPEFCGG